MPGILGGMINLLFSLNKKYTDMEKHNLESFLNLESE